MLKNKRINECKRKAKAVGVIHRRDSSGSPEAVAAEKHSRRKATSEAWRRLMLNTATAEDYNG